MREWERSLKAFLSSVEETQGSTIISSMCPLGSVVKYYRWLIVTPFNICSLLQAKAWHLLGLIKSFLCSLFSLLKKKKKKCVVPIGIVYNWCFLNVFTLTIQSFHISLAMIPKIKDPSTLDTSAALLSASVFSAGQHTTSRCTMTAYTPFFKSLFFFIFHHFIKKKKKKAQGRLKWYSCWNSRAISQYFIGFHISNEMWKTARFSRNKTQVFRQ